MAFLAGKGGKVTVGGTTVPVKSWKAKLVKDELDVSNTTSSGRREFQKGFTHIEATVEGEWDTTNEPFAAVWNIDSVDTVTLALFSDGTGSANISCTLFCSSCDIDAPHDGIIKYTISGKSTGTFTLA